jgi:hypothetical protein
MPALARRVVGDIRAGAGELAGIGAGPSAASVTIESVSDLPVLCVALTPLDDCRIELDQSPPAG